MKKSRLLPTQRPVAFVIAIVTVRTLSINSLVQAGWIPLHGSVAMKGKGIAAFGATTTEKTSSTMEGDNTRIGGGAINERSRKSGGMLLDEDEDGDEICCRSSKYKPQTIRSHLFHALEGLHRYPHYLSRWSGNLNDIDCLEATLKDQLDKVRHQKDELLERHNRTRRLLEAFVSPSSFLSQNSTIRDKPSLIQPPKDWDEVANHILEPRAAQVLMQWIKSPPKCRNNQTNLTLDDVLTGTIPMEVNIGNITTVLEEELDGVYSLPLLRKEFCQVLRERIRAFYMFARSKDPSLFDNNRPFDLDQLGLGWINDFLFQLLIRPISKHLFADNGDLDWRQGYVAAYSVTPTPEAPRERLVTHTDDSEVTLNIGLSDDNMKGGLVEFKGQRRDSVDQQETLRGAIQPKLGRALLHRGRHFHAVSPVTAGDRFSLVVWARSWQGVRSTQCPCCWLNQRQDKSCICGPRWN